jgi:hypothetical protein
VICCRFDCILATSAAIPTKSGNGRVGSYLGRHVQGQVARGDIDASADCLSTITSKAARGSAPDGAATHTSTIPTIPTMTA